MINWLFLVIQARSATPGIGRLPPGRIFCTESIPEAEMYTTLHQNKKIKENQTTVEYIRLQYSNHYVLDL